MSFIDSSLELLVVEELLLVLLGFALSSDFLFLLESSDFFVVIWLVSILGFELSYAWQAVNDIKLIKKC